MLLNFKFDASLFSILCHFGLRVKVKYNGSACVVTVTACVLKSIWILFRPHPSKMAWEHIHYYSQVLIMGMHLISQYF